MQRNFTKKRTSLLEESSIGTEIVGTSRLVPLLDQRLVPQIFFDNAASTKSFQVVSDFLQEILPYYSNIHRGTGFDSMFCTERYEEARDLIGGFVGWDKELDTVIPVRNTTEGMNLLANTIPFAPGDRVLVTILEHHSNDLPWRTKAKVEHLLVNPEGHIDLQILASRLQEANGKVRVVSVCGASNVTGTVMPIYDIAEIAHRYGALVVVDGAQLVPHRQVNMQLHSDPRHIDFLVFSGHKMYCPWGAGAVVGRRDLFEQANPYQPGGGTVLAVTRDRVLWAEAPSRHEGGTPNVLGLLALARTIQVIEAIGMETIAEHEQQLTQLLLRGLTQIPEVTILGAQDPEDVSNRLGVVSFQVEGVHQGLVAAILSYEWGIAVRHGCFCAHPLINYLMAITKEQQQQLEAEILQGNHRNIPGVARISLGLHNTQEEVQTLIEAVGQITQRQWKGVYELDETTGEFYPKGFRFDFNAFPGFSAVAQQEVSPQYAQEETTVPYIRSNESLPEPVKGNFPLKLSWKHGGLVAGGIALAAGGGWAIRSLTHPFLGQEAMSLSTVPVTTLTLRSQLIASPLELSGTIRPVEQATLSTRVNGKITSLQLEAGDRIQKGQVVARINTLDIAAQTSQARSGVTQAQAELARSKATVLQLKSQRAEAQATLRLAQIEQKRMAKLQAQGAIAQVQLDTANVNLEQATARVAQTNANIRQATATIAQSQAAIGQAQAGVNTASVNESYGTVVAPFDGVVVQKLAYEGEMAAPGTALLKVENPNRLQLEASVPEENLRLVRVGQSVQVRVDAVRKTLNAVIEQIVPASDSNSRSFLIKIALTNSGNLISGLFGRVSLSQASQPGMTVPKSALIRRGQLEGVYVVESTPKSGSTALLRWVKTGKHQDENVEIVAGLMSGDRIVSSNVAQLRDGQPVTFDR